MPNTTLTLADLADEAYQWFETATRPDSEERFVRLRDGASEWVSELVREAHGHFLPDDWRYQTIRDALGFLSDNPSADEDDRYEFADSAVDVYSGSLIAWLGSNLNRIGYVDQAAEDFGAEADVMRMIARGQYAEAEEVFTAVFQSLRDRLVEIEQAARADA